MTVASRLLRARWIVPVDRPPIENGFLVIERGRIAAVGTWPAVAPHAGAVEDLGDAIVLPGLVNAHTHLEFSDVPRPLDAAGGLPGWIGRVVALRRSRPVGEAAGARLAASLRAGLVESLAHGVTTIGDIATALPAAGWPPCGPRVRAYREALGLSPSATPLRGALIRDLDRLGPAGGVSPHAPYTVSSRLGRALLSLAIRRRLPVTMHLAESLAELQFVTGDGGPFAELLAGLGAWPLDRVPPVLPPSDWIGALARCRRGSVVHGTFLGAPPDPTSLARLARHRDRLAVVVCPRTTRLLSGRLPPVAALRAAGVRVAIGTDSRASSPDLSVLAEARELVGGGIVSPAEVLPMITREAAWAVAHESRAGTIAAGRPADLVVLDAGHPVGDPLEAALRPDTRVVATLRAGRTLHGALPRG